MSTFPESQKLDMNKSNFSSWYPIMMNYVANHCTAAGAGQSFIGLTRDAHPIQLCFDRRPDEGDLNESGVPIYARNIPPLKHHGIQSYDAFPLASHLLDAPPDATEEKFEEVRIHNSACLANAKLHLSYTLTDAANSQLNRRIDKYDKDEAEKLAQDTALISSIRETISSDSLKKMEHHEDYANYLFDPRNPKCFTRFAKLLTIARLTHSSATTAGKIARTQTTVNSKFDGYDATSFSDVTRVNYDNLLNDFGDPAQPGLICVNKLVTCLALGSFKMVPMLDPVVFQLSNDIEAGSNMPYYDVIKQVDNFIRENPNKFAKPKAPKQYPAVGFVGATSSSPNSGSKVTLPVELHCKNCNPNYAGRSNHTTQDCKTLVGGRMFDPIAYSTRVSRSLDKQWTSTDAERYARSAKPIRPLPQAPPAPVPTPPPVALVTTSTVPIAPPIIVAPVPAPSPADIPPPRQVRRTRARPYGTDPVAIANQAFANYMMCEYDRNQDDDYSDYLNGDF